MIEININPSSALDNLKLIQAQLGGEISNSNNQYKLFINNELAHGEINYANFDWGIHYMDFKIKFFDEVVIKTTSTEFNPLRFMYSLKGFFYHRFGVDKTERKVDEFHSLIFTNKNQKENFIHFPKDIRLHINMIQLERESFLRKKSSNVLSLNQRLHDIFVDTDHKHQFAHHGAFNLKIGDYIQKINNLKGVGMAKVLKMEALVYEILSFHIQQHDKSQKGISLPTSLATRELKIIRKISRDIIKNPSPNYTLNDLSVSSGLSQAKLQEGFKFLFKRTVTEYIRHIRLEKAKELLDTSGLNISQVVYSIGFTSRSYFSKIFKEKFKISPNEYRKLVIKNRRLENVAA
ncbi:MAG: AraC family transcriptional regulator [Bacteroidota bacterium]